MGEQMGEEHTSSTMRMQCQLKMVQVTDMGIYYRVLAIMVKRKRVKAK